MNAEISETIRATILGLGMQNPEEIPKVCFSRKPRPLQRPQAAQNCGAHNLHARYKILAEMYWSSQYLSIDPKKSMPRLF